MHFLVVRYMRISSFPSLCRWWRKSSPVPKGVFPNIFCEGGEIPVGSSSNFDPSHIGLFYWVTTPEDRTGYVKMDMILTDMTTQDRYAPRFAGLTNQIAGTLRYITCQYPVSVLPHPYQMVLNVIDRMRAFTVVLAHWIPPTSDYSKTPYVLKLFA